MQSSSGDFDHALGIRKSHDLLKDRTCKRTCNNGTQFRIDLETCQDCTVCAKDETEIRACTEEHVRLP